MQGDHAGIAETSLMLYLDRELVHMDRISDINYKDHYWNEDTTPQKASSEKGEADVKLVIDHLRQEIEKAVNEK